MLKVCMLTESDGLMIDRIVKIVVSKQMNNRDIQMSKYALPDLRVCLHRRSRRVFLQIFLEDRPEASWQVVAARALSITSI